MHIARPKITPGMFDPKLVDDGDGFKRVEPTGSNGAGAASQDRSVGETGVAEVPRNR